MAEWMKKLKDKRFWNKVTLKDIRKEMRRLDVEIRREQAELHRNGKKELELKSKAKGKSKIEKRGIAKEIKMLRRESKAHEAMVTNSYNQRTTLKQVELYKIMEKKARKKGLLKTFKKNQDRVIDLITEKGIDITDEMQVWNDLASETDIVFDSIIEPDEEEDDILAELEEDELDDDMEGLDSLDDDFDEEEEIVSLKRKRTRKE